MHPRAEAIIRENHLTPHPEGGWFREIYTSPWTAAGEAAGRAAMGSIYFLLSGAERSHLHVIDCDEIWYHHEGADVLLHQILPDGTATQSLLGPGGAPMVLIPKGVIFGAEMAEGTGYAWMSCATTPGFRYEGFRLVNRAELGARFPALLPSLGEMAMEQA